MPRLCWNQSQLCLLLHYYIIQTFLFWAVLAASSPGTAHRPMFTHHIIYTYITVCIYSIALTTGQSHTPVSPWDERELNQCLRLPHVVRLTADHKFMSSSTLYGQDIPKHLHLNISHIHKSQLWKIIYIIPTIVSSCVLSLIKTSISKPQILDSIPYFSYLTSAAYSQRPERELFLMPVQLCVINTHTISSSHLRKYFTQTFSWKHINLKLTLVRIKISRITFITFY